MPESTASRRFRQSAPMIMLAGLVLAAAFSNILAALLWLIGGLLGYVLCRFDVAAHQGKDTDT